MQYVHKLSVKPAPLLQNIHMHLSIRLEAPLQVILLSIRLEAPHQVIHLSIRLEAPFQVSHLSSPMVHPSHLSFVEPSGPSLISTSSLLVLPGLMQMMEINLSMLYKETKEIQDINISIGTVAEVLYQNGKLMI